MDEGHGNKNIRTVKGLGDSVVIEYSFIAKKVISLIAVPDETYSANGITVGSTVGVQLSKMHFYRLKSGEIQPIGSDEACFESGNIWIYGIFEVEI